MNWKKAGIIAGVTAGVFLSMKYVFPVMIPFLIGWFLSEMIYPMAYDLANRRVSRRLHLTESGIGAAIILALTLIGVGGVLMGAEFLTEKIGDCVKYFPVMKAEAGKLIEQCCQGAERIVGIPARESSQYIYAQISSIGSSIMKDGKGMDTAIDSVRWCVLVIGMLMIAIVAAILFLQEREKIRSFMENRTFYNKMKHVGSELRASARAYFKAQFKIMAAVCGVCILGLWVLRVRSFFGFGLAIGILDALPILGTGLFFIPGGILSLLRGKTVLGAGFFLLYLITAAIRQFMEPRLIGSHVGVSPLLVLFSVYVGVFLYGGFGFVLGPLSALLLYGIFKEWNLLKL